MTQTTPCGSQNGNPDTQTDLSVISAHQQSDEYPPQNAKLREVYDRGVAMRATARNVDVTGLMAVHRFLLMFVRDDGEPPALTVPDGLDANDFTTGWIEALDAIQPALTASAQEPVAVKPLDLSALLRHAFLTGRGLGDLDKLSDADQAAWMEYDPEPMRAYQRIYSALYATPQPAPDTERRTAERCAEIVGPKGDRPCDCTRCICTNNGDAEAVAAWDEAKSLSNAIRAAFGLPAQGEDR